MNLSGIVVAVPPHKLQDGIAALNALAHVEVHQYDQQSGQIVIVQEAENIHQEVEGLKKIKALPMVTYAEMVYHYMAEDDSLNVMPSDDIDDTQFQDTLNKLNQ